MLAGEPFFAFFIMFYCRRRAEFSSFFLCVFCVCGGGGSFFCTYLLPYDHAVVEHVSQQSTAHQSCTKQQSKCATCRSERIRRPASRDRVGESQRGRRAFLYELLIAAFSERTKASKPAQP